MWRFLNAQCGTAPGMSITGGRLCCSRTRAPGEFLEDEQLLPTLNHPNLKADLRSGREMGPY